MKLLAVNRDAKTRKGNAKGYLTGILYLVPANGSGLGNLCPHASEGCRAACLFTAGRGVMRPVAAGRLRKTRLFFDNAAAFVDMLAADIARLVARADRLHMIPTVRLNGTSDIRWERVKGTGGLPLMAMFPHVQFYDYTKWPNRETGFANYHLTFSRSETNTGQAFIELSDGRNVAVVFDTKRGHALPTGWRGFTVVDGDESDLRFLDTPRYGVGMVIGLRAKGRAKGEASGFVQKGAA